MKMKNLVFALTCIITVSGTLPAAARGAYIPSISATGIETETARDQAGLLQAETEEDSFKVEIVDDLTVTTPYYIITVPDHWADSYTFETVDNFTGKWLKLFHTDPRTGFADGHLFSILLTEDEEYKKIADNDLLGELEDIDGNKYHVVAVFPTDVQYTKEGRNAYMALFKDAEDVLATITPAVGCEYDKTDPRFP